MVPPFVAISLIVGIVLYGLLRFPWLLTFASVFVIFWGGLLCVFVVSVFSFKMKIEQEGVSLQTLWVRLFKGRFFPTYLRFDEVQIKLVWDGRILVFVSGDELSLPKRMLIVGGVWVMPFKWRESIEIIENLQNASVTRS
jgi:hypothetical protein